MKRIILTLHCPDDKGIISRITTFLAHYNANILHMDQHSTQLKNGVFFCRCECIISKENYQSSSFKETFTTLGSELNATWQFHDCDKKMRVGILVSKPGHCLHEILHQWDAGDLNIEIPFVISNHPDHKEMCTHYRLPFHYIPSSSNNRLEADIEAIIQDSDCLVLARYMQIISSAFIERYSPRKIINIHHSFLPSFKGANPYQQAYDKGVKVIGATAHFVTAELDEGPIIYQTVNTITHKDGPNELKMKGKYLEKIGVSEALKLFSEHRILLWKNRTIIF